MLSLLLFCRSSNSSFSETLGFDSSSKVPIDNFLSVEKSFQNSIVFSQSFIHLFDAKYRSATAHLVIITAKDRLRWCATKFFGIYLNCLKSFNCFFFFPSACSHSVRTPFPLIESFLNPPLMISVISPALSIVRNENGLHWLVILFLFQITG